MYINIEIIGAETLFE